MNVLGSQLLPLYPWDKNGILSPNNQDILSKITDYVNTYFDFNLIILLEKSIIDTILPTLSAYYLSDLTVVVVDGYDANYYYEIKSSSLGSDWSSVKFLTNYNPNDFSKITTTNPETDPIVYKLYIYIYIYYNTI